MYNLFGTFAMVFFLSASNANADRGWCGELDEVVFEPQSYIVVNEVGVVLPLLPNKIQVGTNEAIWNGESWYGAGLNRFIDTKLSFDSNTGVYLSETLKVKTKSRWKPLPGCKDMVYPLTVTINRGERSKSNVDVKYHGAIHSIDLKAYMGRKIRIPSPSQPHKIVLKARDVLEARLIRKIEGEEASSLGHVIYEIESEGARYYISKNVSHHEELLNLDKAYEENRKIVVYGEILPKYDGEEFHQILVDYVDVL